MTHRLSESTLPLRQISLDSVHEKSVRHGHISTLHIWPARRPLAASRAMLLATLLPDSGDSEARRRVGLRMAGRLVPKRLKGGGEHTKLKETSGGILHWGRQNGVELERFRNEIRDAFDGRAPRVLDPFAGGGAIPLEAMRLGCETFASDLNPVAGTPRRGFGAADVQRLEGRCPDGRRLRVASAGLGTPCARQRAAEADGPVSNLGGVRAGAAQGQRTGGDPGRESVQAAAASPARFRRRGPRFGRGAERRIRLALSGRRDPSALGGQARRRIPVGAHG